MFGTPALAIATKAQHLREHAGDRHPNTRLLPSAVAAIDAVPLPTAAWHFSPWRPAAEVPQDAVDHHPIVASWTAFATALGRQQRRDQRPFGIGQIAAADPLSPP